MVLATPGCCGIIRGMARRLRVEYPGAIYHYWIAQDSAAGRRVLAQALEARGQAEAGADYRLIRRGWCLGAETFRKGLKRRRWQESDMTKRAKGGSRQGADRGAVAGGDDGDGEVDRGAVGDGHGELREQPVVSVAQGNAGVKALE